MRTGDGSLIPCERGWGPDGIAERGCLGCDSCVLIGREKLSLQQKAPGCDGHRASNALSTVSGGKSMLPCRAKCGFFKTVVSKLFSF